MNLEFSYKYYFLLAVYFSVGLSYAEITRGLLNRGEEGELMSLPQYATEDDHVHDALECNSRDVLFGGERAWGPVARMKQLYDL